MQHLNSTDHSDMDNLRKGLHFLLEVGLGVSLPVSWQKKVDEKGSVFIDSCCVRAVNRMKIPGKIFDKLCYSLGYASQTKSA